MFPTQTISDMQYGDICTFQLDCGSLLEIQRAGGGYCIAIADSRNFANVGSVSHRVFEDQPNWELLAEPWDGKFQTKTHNRLCFYVSDAAVPFLRLLLCGMERARK